MLTGDGLENFSVGMNLNQGIERMGGPDALLDQRLRVINAIPRGASQIPADSILP